MTKSTKSTEELILEVLREVLAREQKDAGAQPTTPEKKQAVVSPKRTAARSKSPKKAIDPVSGLRREQLAELEAYEALAQAPLSPDATARRFLWRMMLGLLLAVVLINIPVFGGLSLARALPDVKAITVRPGLVIKGSGPEIYVLESYEQDGVKQLRKRWISSLAAFERYGFRWDAVHEVDDDFLAQFPDARPIYLLLKCSGPHVYRIENDKKRWIKDIETFEAEGHSWRDVRQVDCHTLRNIPDGLPIPEDAGKPPRP